MNKLSCTPIALALTLLTQASLKAQSSDEEVFELDPFQVTTTEGYKATNTISGTALNTPLKKVPMTINVVTSDFLDDSLVGDFNEALDYNTSITQTTRQPVSINNAIFSIRGFRNSNNLVDGVLGGDFVPTILIDRIEVVKGPNTLYGQSDPGGLINTITKRPKAADDGNVTVKFGNNGWFQANTDITVRTAEDRLGLRLLAEHRENDGWRDVDGMEENVVAVSGEYAINEGLDTFFLVASSEKEGVPTQRATWSFERIPTDLNGDGDLDDVVGGVTEATARYNNTFIPRDYSTATIDNVFEMNNMYMTLGFRQNIGENGVLQYKYNNYTNELLTTFREFNTFEADGTSQANYAAEFQRDEHEVHTLNYTASIDFGETTHNILAGYRPSRSIGGLGEGNYRLRYANAAERAVLEQYALDNPDKDIRMVLTKEDILSGARIQHENAPSASEIRVLGSRSNDNGKNIEKIDTLYLTDNIELFDDKLDIMLGVRYIDVNTTSYAYSDPNTLLGELSEDDTSFQFGVIYDLTNKISVFGNAADSFRPQSGVSDITGEPFGPETSEAFEMGFKFDSLLNGKVGGTFSVFQINKDNVVRRQFNPVTFTNDLAQSDDKSEGIELELFYNPISNWDVVFSYSHINARVVDSIEGSLLGLALEGATPDRASLFTSYRFENGPLSGLRFGGGLVWADGPIQQFGNAVNRLVVEDGYTTVDLFARYSTQIFERDVTFGFNVDNATDEFYVRARAATNNARQYVFSVTTNF